MARGCLRLVALVAASLLARGTAADQHVAPGTVDRLPTWIDPDADDNAEAGCDPGAGGDVDASELIEDEPPDRTIETPAPSEWRSSRGRDCQRYRGRQVCDGPLRAPQPSERDADRARELGIEERTASRIAMQQEPPGAWLEATPRQVGPGLLWPIAEGRLWRGYGRHRAIVQRRGGGIARGRRYRQHEGVDIGAPEGSPIRAVNAGLVLYSFNGMRGYGNAVILLHGDGTMTLYAHCRATLVVAGQRVERGQVIAEVGDTGLAHGAHLHFEWRRSGRTLDPLEHFVGRADELLAASPPQPRSAEE
jgi:murein DD-endopeptidase MepM/ murein hydrolase activator NlpD